MTATMANVDAALKEDIQPGLAEQLNTMFIMLTQIGSNTKDTQGRHALIKAHLGRNVGVGARAVGGNLPSPGSQKYVESRIAMIRNYGSMGIDGDLIDASASDTGSVVRHLAAETEGMLNDTKYDVNRQIYNLPWQSLAVCGTTSSSNTIVLETLSKAQIRHIQVGRVIDIGTEGDPDSVASGRTITAFNSGASTIVIDGAAVTTSSSHAITGTEAGGVELTGLRDIVRDTGALQLLDPATAGQEVWASQLTAVGGNADENVFEVIIEDIETESGQTPNLIMTTKGVRRNFKAQLEGQRRYVDTIDIKAGFKAITVCAGNAELPLAVDDDCPAGEANVLNTSTLVQYRMGKEWQFLDRDGAILKLVPGKDSYVAHIANYHQLGTTHRNTHGRLTGLTES